MKRIFITGSSGYMGSELIRQIRQQAPQAVIVGTDVKSPQEDAVPDQFLKGDVRSPEVAAKLREFRPDTVVHLAFVVNPIHNLKLMHSINVDGTRNLFQALADQKPERFLMASSATVYGGFPDNPVPAPETWPCRSRRGFQYAEDKVLLEQMIAEFAESRKEIAVSWVRPCIIYGPRVNNFLSTFLLLTPVIALLDGNDTPLQFVHEVDVVAATLAVLKANGRGPYNIGPNDWVPLSQVAQATGAWALKVPFGPVHVLNAAWWGMRLPGAYFPAGLLYFLKHPWVVCSNRLRTELGFRFRYSSRDTLNALLESQGRKGRLPPLETPAATEPNRDQFAA